MNRFDIINRIGDKYRVGNTETGEFSYAQALKTVGKDIKDYQKATTGTQHKRAISCRSNVVSFGW